MTPIRANTKRRATIGTKTAEKDSAAAVTSSPVETIGAATPNVEVFQTGLDEDLKK